MKPSPDRFRDELGASEQVPERRRTQLGNVVQGKPLRIGESGVVSNPHSRELGAGGLERNSENDIDNMFLSRKKISQEDGSLRSDLDAGFFPDLALHAIMEGFAFVEPSSGQQPEGVGPVPDEEDLPFVDQKSGDTDAERHGSKVSAGHALVKSESRGPLVRKGSRCAKRPEEEKTRF
jgi:hypothetical protein